MRYSLLLTLILAALVSSDATDKQAAPPAATTPAAKTIPPVTTPALVTPPPAKVESTPAKVESTPAKVESTPAKVESTPSTTSATTAPPAKVESTPSAPSTPVTPTTPSPTGNTESNPKPKPMFRGPAVISENLMHGSKVKFQSFNVPKPFQTYLQQTLDFNAVKHLFTALHATNPNLQSRGDAHITVINPQEYDQVLSKAGITMNEIEHVANRHRVQSARFTPLCMGRSRITIESGKDEVYFIVVKSPELVKIRQEVQKLYVKKGGEISLFQAEAFWPHITVAFTKRDVFLFPDQIFKGLNACVKPVKVLRHHGRKPKRHPKKHPKRHPRHPKRHYRHPRHHHGRHEE